MAPNDQAVLAARGKLARAAQDKAGGPSLLSAVRTSVNVSGPRGEAGNFVALQKRYMKSFLAAYFRHSEQMAQVNSLGLEEGQQKSDAILSGWNVRNQTMYLVNSDFDTEDEEFGDDIAEVISAHLDHHSDSIEDETKSDD